MDSHGLSLIWSMTVEVSQNEMYVIHHMSAKVDGLIKYTPIKSKRRKWTGNYGPATGDEARQMKTRGAWLLKSDEKLQQGVVMVHGRGPLPRGVERRRKELYDGAGTTRGTWASGGGGARGAI
jgi:hypothetical protein